ncbi:hypothetical protein MNBD_GAMMA22-887 [hydrothermal vent metagenome]|uniref:Coenzyme Q-binding protein COQ10 START domain-containing protein n=1 Tax=hydrothermal vent metagenome TaxID=652676 RepID=A0A3B1ARE0_9ZZZZ
MKNNDLSITIPAPKDAVFNYLVDVENFPEWATEFCHELKQKNGHYKIVSPMGELYFRINSDETSGEIKYFATSELNGDECLSSKVSTIDNNSCQYMVDFYKTECISDEVFETQCNSIKLELQNIKNNFKPDQ